MTATSTMFHIAAEFVSNNCASDGVPDPACINKAIEDSGTAFKVAQSFFRVVGVLIVVWTLVSVIKAIIGVKTAEAIKKFLGGILAAVLCFNLRLPLDLIQGVGSVISAVVEEINNLLGGASKKTPGK